MIIHGMADDVVPFQTSVQLAEELIKQRKEFDLVLAPAATHRWATRPDDAAYLFNKLIGHFDRYLGPGPRPSDQAGVPSSPHWTRLPSRHPRPPPHRRANTIDRH